MAGSPVDTGGVSKLVGQLRSASSSSERNLAAVEDLRSSLEEMKEKLESGHDGLRSAVEEILDSAKGQGDEAEGSIQSLTSTSQGGASSRLPGASGTLSEASSETEASHEGETERLGSLAETLTEQGFGEVSTALSAVVSDEQGAAGDLQGTIADLEEERQGIQEALLAAESAAVEQIDAAQSTLQNEVQTEMEATGQTAAADLETQAGNAEQDAAQMSSQLQEAYGQWSAEQEQEQDRLRTTVSEVVEQTVGALLEGAMDQLDTPCSEALQNHAPSAMGEMEGVASAVGDWVNSCGELSTAAGELDRGHDAKRRLDALFEGGG